MKRSLLLSLLLLVALTGPASAYRAALVIGNNQYDQVMPLFKAVNDAQAMADALRDVGFDVITGENLTRREMNVVLQKFTSKLQAGDEAFFFFAGHGVAIDGRNYLLPSDVPNAGPGQEGLIEGEAFAVDRIAQRIRSTGARISILVLDACRDNPFKKSGTRSLGGARGFARMEAPEGTFVMYSAAAGQMALDRLSVEDSNPNSIFTRSLVPLIRTPGLSLADMARRVRREVKGLAAKVGHDQRPAYYDELTSDVYLAGAPDATAQSAGTTPKQTLAPTVSPEAHAWSLVEKSEDPGVYRAFLETYSSGVYAALALSHLKRLEEKRPGTGNGASLARPTRQGEKCVRLTDQMICASSALASQGSNAYGPRNLGDGRASTAWVEGRGGQGVGEWITVAFGGARDVAGIDIRNGYGKSVDIFRKNSRVRELEIRFSNGSSVVETLADSPDWQYVDLSPSGPVDWVQMRILSVYPGQKYQDTAISELKVDVR